MVCETYATRWDIRYDLIRKKTFTVLSENFVKFLSDKICRHLVGNVVKKKCKKYEPESFSLIEIEN